MSQVQQDQANLTQGTESTIIQHSFSLYFFCRISIFSPVDWDPASLEQRRQAFWLALYPQKEHGSLWIWLWKFSHCHLCVRGLICIYLNPRLEYWSPCVIPEPSPFCLNMLLWIMVSFMTHSRGGLESFTVMQEILSACDRASVNPPSSGHCLLGQGDRFTPAASIRAARWSACASAPPSCPCSSDSLSSAAKCLPASDSRGTHPLGNTQAQTNSIRWLLFRRQTVRTPVWATWQ